MFQVKAKSMSHIKTTKFPNHDPNHIPTKSRPTNPTSRLPSLYSVNYRFIVNWIFDFSSFYAVCDVAAIPASHILHSFSLFWLYSHPLACDSPLSDSPTDPETPLHGQWRGSRIPLRIVRRRGARPVIL